MRAASVASTSAAEAYPAAFARSDQNGAASVVRAPSPAAGGTRQDAVSDSRPDWQSATRLTLSKAAEQRFEREALLRYVIEKNLAGEPPLREVVYQTIDTRSGDVVYQVPTEAALKLKIYARTMAGDPSIRTKEVGSGESRTA